MSLQDQQAADLPAGTKGSGALGTLPRKATLLLAVALALGCVIVGIGFWVTMDRPPMSDLALGALAVSAIVSIASLATGLYVNYRALRAKREAARLQAQARDEARQSAQARIALLGMVSHELRTPLQTMLVTVELLTVRPQTPETARLLQVLDRCIVQIKGRLDNLAQYVRLAGTHVEPRHAPFRLVELLERTISEHAEDAQANDQALRLDADGLTSAQVAGDEIRLHQIVGNFLSNAVKYAGPGIITVQAKQLPHVFGPTGPVDAVEVSVSDHGPSIPEAERQAVWEPLTRGAAEAGRSKGSGLGLAIVKLLATAASWDVGMRCTVDGTTFFVVLPMGGSAEPIAGVRGEGKKDFD